MEQEALVQQNQYITFKIKEFSLQLNSYFNEITYCRG